MNFQDICRTDQNAPKNGGEKKIILIFKKKSDYKSIINFAIHLEIEFRWQPAVKSSVKWNIIALCCDGYACLLLFKLY